MAVRQLRQMSRNGGQSLLKFMYNADGIRTNKIVDGVNHVYTLNGTQIVSEAWGNHLVIYLYDESGSPIGRTYDLYGIGKISGAFFCRKNILEISKKRLRFLKGYVIIRKIPNANHQRLSLSKGGIDFGR